MTHSNGQSHETIGGQRVEWYSSEAADIDRSMIGTLESRSAEVSRSAVSRLQAEEAAFDQAFIGTAVFDRGTLRQSTAGAVAGRSIACDEVRTAVLAAPVVRGQVHTWFDMRSAVAVGVGIVLGKVAIGLIGGLLRRALR